MGTYQFYKETVKNREIPKQKRFPPSLLLTASRLLQVAEQKVLASFLLITYYQPLILHDRHRWENGPRMQKVFFL